MLELFTEEETVELEVRTVLLRGLERWLGSVDLTQTDAARKLGVTQARISDLKRRKVSKFSVDMLVRLAARAGLHPTISLAAVPVALRAGDMSFQETEMKARRARRFRNSVSDTLEQPKRRSRSDVAAKAVR